MTTTKDRAEGWSDDWAEAEDALRAGRWRRAVDLFTALASSGDPRAHVGLAQAAWWLDDAEGALGSREAAYRSFREAGDLPAAARAAATLGYDSMLFGAGVAVGRGWLARAEDLLAGAPASPEAGWLAVRQGEVALAVDHDAATGRDAALRARAIGADTGDLDLSFVAEALGGLAAVRLGDVASGMPHLDAAAAAATAGDVSDLMWVGKICCWLISACQETHDLDRAGEWCARVEEICERRDLMPLFAVCRTQYASILLAGGRSSEAEEALVDVMDRLATSRRASRLDAVAQLGELRRRQGRLTEAEDLLQQAGFRPDAVTSLAALRLDQGDSRRAWSTVAELLRTLPPGQLLERVDALSVAVASGLQAGHEAEARDAARELREIADRVGTPALLAHADVAAARLLADEQAVAPWQDAARRFQAAGLVFDEADARRGLAGALRTVGDESGAREQDDRADRLLASLHAPAASHESLTPRQLEVLRLVGRGRSNAEIAAELHLSQHTVHRHISNIYAALDLGSRAAAVSYAVQSGWI